MLHSSQATNKFIYLKLSLDQMVRKVKNFIWPRWYLDNCIPTTKDDTRRKKCRQDFATGFPSKPSVSVFDGKRRRSGINELSDKSGSKCYEACGDEGAHQGERKRRACQTRPQGWNRYGVWQSVFVKGVNVISYKVRSKRKAAETATTVRRRAAFRKTQTPSADSLTERLPERKIFVL